MTPNWLSPLATKFLFGYSALFAIINLFGLAFIFLARTDALTETEQKAIAKRVAVYALAVLVASLYLGTIILNFFGISIPALRIAGGLVVISSGWHLLDSGSQGEGSLANSRQDFETVSGAVFFPLTMPLTTGPGTIATAIALGAHQQDGVRPFFSSAVSVLVAGAISLTIFYAYSRSGTLARLVGVEGTRVITRLSAFLLLCVGVQIMLIGLSEHIRLLAPVLK